MAEAPVAAGNSEFTASGKRKTAVARVRLRLGSGQFRINGRSLEDYFQRESLVRTVQQPLELSGLLDRYDVFANLDGSGLSAQAGALQHGIARAIEKLDPGLLEMTKIQGLGPKRIKLMYDELGISNVDLLRDAAERGEIARLVRRDREAEGMGIDNDEAVAAVGGVHRQRAQALDLE